MKQSFKRLVSHDTRRFRSTYQCFVCWPLGSLRNHWLSRWECMAMTPETLFNMLHIEVFSTVFGLCCFAFVAGHAAGTTIGATRKITHMAT